MMRGALGTRPFQRITLKPRVWNVIISLVFTIASLSCASHHLTPRKPTTASTTHRITEPFNQLAGMNMKYCLITMLPVVLLLTARGDAAPENMVGQEDSEPVIVVDILNQTLIGQCAVPRICLDKKQSCGIDENHHVTVNCSNRNAGPYVPDFQSYILPRRTWDIDFSYNYIRNLDSQSFIIISSLFTFNVPINLTALDLSHNYISNIAADTFSGEVSRLLATLDLSHNYLKELKPGTFDDVPALTKLKLFNNKLVTMDAICQTSFQSLDVLDMQYNLLASLPHDCLSSSSTTVTLNLNYNYIGSVDDCSYSNKVRAQIEKNPIMCGCSDKFTNSPCLRIDSVTNSSAPSSQPACSTTQCTNVSFTAVPTWYDQQQLYTVAVKPLSNGEHVVDILKYKTLADESYSIQLVQSQSAVISEMTSSQLSANGEYSACVRLASDNQGRFRSCQYLSPPAYVRSGASYSTVSIAMLGFAITIILRS